MFCSTRQKGELTVDEIRNTLTNLALSRRGFIAGAGAVTAATLVGCGSDSPATPVTPVTPTITDVDILNFALNLEYLEAEFYLRAATGTGLSTADGAGTVTGGAKVAFTSPVIQAYAVEIAQNELNHVRALRATITSLGGTPVGAPNINLSDSFNAAAAAAGIGAAFNPFASDDAFLVGAFVFEDVGVTAYTGAATLIKSKTVLSAAAGIQAVEAYHAGEIRALIAGRSISANTQTYITYANQISALRAKLGGAFETTLSSGVTLNSSGAVTAVAPSTIVAADTTNARAYARSTDNVLHIVYATAPGTLTKGGAFFPNGLNGTISTPTT
jgi:hypothetical protein